MFKRIHIKLISSILFVACTLLAMSCSDVQQDEPVNNDLITLKVTLPEDETVHPVVRSGDPVSGTEEESKIQTLKFFIYKNSTTLEAYRSIKIEDDGTCNDPMWDAQNKALRITVTPGSKLIYCIANWAETSTAEMPLIDDQNADTEAKLLAKIRTHNGVTPVNPPVMTGVEKPTLDGSEQELKISLKRQIARVDLSFKMSDIMQALGADIKILGVRFKNLATTAYVFPQSSLASPAGVSVWHQTVFAGSTSNALTTTAVDYATKYYIPEYIYTGGVEANATTMIIKAEYNGTATYYSVAIDPSTSTQIPVHGKYVIERNHIYKYELTIQGIGSLSEPTRSVEQSTGANITYNLEVK